MVYRHRDKQAGGPDHIVFQGGKQIQFHRPSKTPDSARVASLKFLSRFKSLFLITQQRTRSSKEFQGQASSYERHDAERDVDHE